MRISLLLLNDFRNASAVWFDLLKLYYNFNTTVIITLYTVI